MTLQVIGTGFGRTGTDSMREALEILGFGPCHHMHEIMDNSAAQTMWQDQALNRNHKWAELFKGYNACVDWPSAYYWCELTEAYPEAKVVLTWRSAESWWNSFERTILQSILNTESPDSLALSLISNGTFGSRSRDREHAIAVYNAHVEEVKRTIAPDRLHVHTLGDGWEGLCRHLDVVVPAQPFPNRNNTAEYLSNMATESSTD